MADSSTDISVDFNKNSVVVVGVDGSKAADQALYWAMKEAKLRNASLKIVHAWEYPSLVYGVYSDEGLDLESGGKEVLKRSTELARSIDANTLITTVLKEGNAVSILADEAADADLLVVGSRGHGGFTSLVLGSVSSQLSHHSPAPLVIVNNR